MIDIPMNTKPPISLSAMASGQPAQSTVQQAMPQQQVVQQPVQRPVQQQVVQQQPVQRPVQQAMPQQPVQRPVQQAMPQQPVQRPVQQTAPAQSQGKKTGVILRKGQKTALVGANGGNLTTIKAGLSWDVSDPNYDPDVECFMLGDNGKVIGDDWFVFYGSLTSPDGSVTHSGDCKDGRLPGDDETITINLQRIDPRVKKLVFVVTIDQAKEKGLSFAGIQNAKIHIQDCTSGTDLCQFNLTDYYSNVTSMVIGEIYNHNGQWKFNPVGDGTASDLYDLCRVYGVNVQG